jgi:hypothetical protein
MFTPSGKESRPCRKPMSPLITNLAACEKELMLKIKFIEDINRHYGYYFV